MLGIQALAVIAENLDDPAIPARALLAGFHHGPYLGSQSDKLNNLGVNLAKVCSGQIIRTGARLLGMGEEGQELPDGSDVEPKVPGMADERRRLTFSMP